MKKKNLIVLDIDDTLTKSQDTHVNALLYAMQHFGIEKVDTDWRNYKHASDSFIFKTNYEKTHSKRFLLDFIPEFQEIMTEHFLEGENTVEILGAKKAVDFFMNETNYAVCFATGSIYMPGLLKLEQAEINFSKEVLSASNTLFSREEIVLSAIQKAKKHYKVSAFKNIISFGDGLWDVSTAKNLGLDFVGVNNKNLADFKRMDVKYHISNWLEFDIHKMETIFK